MPSVNMDKPLKIDETLTSDKYKNAKESQKLDSIC